MDETLEPTDLTDDELTALALAADPLEPLAPDARPMAGRDWSLPVAYMPPVAVGSYPRSTVRTIAAFAIIGAFLAITALGFCATYGALSFA